MHAANVTVAAPRLECSLSSLLLKHLAFHSSFQRLFNDFKHLFSNLKGEMEVTGI